VCVPWARENFDRLVAALDDLDSRLDLPPRMTTTASIQAAARRRDEAERA
jgi:hypothetical protein